MKSIIRIMEVKRARSKRSAHRWSFDFRKRHAMESKKEFMQWASK